MESTYQDATNKYEVERPLIKETQIALWICLGTLCRIGELLKSEWSHVDFKKRIWHIPLSNVKGTSGKKQEQYIYLSNFVLKQFKELHELTNHSKWIFPASNKEGHVCEKSISKQVGDRQIKFKNRKKLLLNRVNTNSLVLGDAAWTPHDLRRTGATMMQSLKIPLDVIDRCQNHILAGSKIRRHYLKYEYLAEKQNAWELLSNRLEMILNNQNVLEFKKAI
jgi:integrase